MSSQRPIWQGYLLTGVLFFVGILSSIFNCQQLYTSYLIGFRIRSMLIGAIYKKALNISNEIKKERNIGEIVNLMAVDVQRQFNICLYIRVLHYICFFFLNFRFYDIMGFFHCIWSIPLSLILATYLLWHILGISALAGLFSIVLLIPINAWVGVNIKRLQAQQMKLKDERIKLINELLNGIKILKLYAWEPSFEKIIENVRNAELKILKKIGYINAFGYYIWNMLPFLVGPISFFFFVN